MKPNVLLIVLDSVRARNVSLYGHANETTPFLEDLSEEATVYTQARSPSTWSLPSHTSMFTGLHVQEHGVTFREYRLVEGKTVWERLRDEYGYATGVFSANPYLTEVPVGLKRAFETVMGRVDLPFPEAADPREFVRQEGHGRFFEYLIHSFTTDRPVASLTNGVYEKLERDFPTFLPKTVRPTASQMLYTNRFLEWQHCQSKPWAACINLMDAHHPYEPEPKYNCWGGDRLLEIQDAIESPMWEFNGGHRPWWQRKALEALYDGAIRQMDAQLEHLITELDNRGVFDNTLLVITSDHGEGFGEPSVIRPGARAVGHGNGGVHEVLLHVPLVVSFPTQVSPTRVEKVCSLTSFPRAVMDVVTGEWAVGEEFVTDDPVLASTNGLNERMRRNARQFCDDLFPFDGVAHAVYRNADDAVQQFVTWRSKAATVAARDAQISFKLSSNGAEEVEREFSGLEGANVREKGKIDLDGRVQRRLDHLGYA